jgi:hypothetical protein
MAIVKFNGVEGCDAALINGVERADIEECSGVDYSQCGATRWMAGGGLGRIFTTSASNGLNGWGDGERTNGAVADVGNGSVFGIAYGRSGNDEADPDRWVVGLGLKSGASGSIVYINSGSAHDGAGRPVYASASNWVSGGAPPGPQFQRQSIAYGNDVWMAGTLDVNVSGDYQTFYRSTDFAANWTRLAESNDEADESHAMCYKGTGNIWMAAHGKSIWKSTDNGANWSRIFEPDTAIWNCIAYDGARWMIAGSGGDAWYSDNDGTNWTDQSSRTGTSKEINGLVFMGGSVQRWIVVCADGVAKSQTNALIDADEDNWTNLSGPDSTTMNAIATDHVTAVAVGQSGRIWVTTNGTSWTAADRNDNVGTQSLKCIACDIIGSGIYK